MTPDAATASLILPETVEAAIAALRDGGGEILGGGTWIMRGPTRYEPVPDRLVALDRIAELHDCTVLDDRIRLGAMARHDRIAGLLPPDEDLRGLAIAAGQSANPGIRRLATVGGNLAAHGFAAADLVPALMCLDASVEVATAAGRTEMSVADFLAIRRAPGPRIITHVRFDRSHRRTAHARVPMRDYPVCIVSLSLALDQHGRIGDLRLAVGAVEPDARRWPVLEAAARGMVPDPAVMEALARDHIGEFSGHTALDAPAWYRRRVLPSMVRRAFEQVCGGVGQ